MKSKWTYTGYCYQIADTGDYDGHYEISNGVDKIIIKNDDEEDAQRLVDVLNEMEGLYFDDSEISVLKMQIGLIQAERDEYRKALKAIAKECPEGSWFYKTAMKPINKYKDHARG